MLGKTDIFPRKLFQGVLLTRDEIASVPPYFYHTLNEAENTSVYRRYNLESFKEIVLNSLGELELSETFINENKLDHIATLAKCMVR